MPLRLPRALVACAIALATTVACSGADDGDLGPQADAGEAPETDGGATTDATSPTPTRDGGTSPAPTDAGPTSSERTGEATYYDADGTGACGFKTVNTGLFAAMNGSEYKKADCNKCISVTGPKGSVTVRYADKCPGCGKGDVDLSEAAFRKIADLSAGRVAIRWRFVACP